MKVTARTIAATVLERVERDRAYAAAALDAELDRHPQLDPRDRALAALKELEFDHRTGKIDDIDYRALVGPLRRDAAAALRALDEDEPKE